MHGPLTNLPDHHGPRDRVAVLAVSPYRADHGTLRNIFSHTRWELHGATDCRQAIEFLKRNKVGVLVCDSELPDGRWTDLLDNIARIPESPLLVVSARNAGDALWAEALSLGAYDVLSKPFDKAEVIRIVSLAWLQWKQRTRQQGVMKSGPAREHHSEFTAVRRATA